MNRNLTNALREQKKSTEQTHVQIAGLLGIPLDGQRRVEVPNRNAFVYVRLRNNQSEVIQAYNNQVASSYGLPVLVERQGNRYVVTGVDTQRYQSNWASFAPFLPRHGTTHSFDFENGGGGDIVWVHSRQFMPLLTLPSGSDGGPNLIVAPYTLKRDNGTWMYVGNTGTPNITPYRPTTNVAIMALVFIDAVSGNPGLLIGSGTSFSQSITGTSAIIPYIPALTNPNHIPLSAVRLVTGTTVISWDNIYDTRQFLHVIPTGSAGGGLSSIAVQDEGAAQGNVTTFNFVGDGVVASVSGSVARVSIGSGSSGGGSTFTGNPMSAVLTNASGTLFTPAWLKWGTDAEEFIEFGADVVGKEVNAGKMGYNAFGNGHFDIIGAGTGVPGRTVKIYDYLIVDQAIETQSYNIVPAGGSYNITGSPHVHTYSSLNGALTQAAGTYTPLVTGTANVDSVSVDGLFKYMRMGNIVTVAGPLTVDPTIALTNTTVGISLPIVSNFTAAQDGSGNGNSQLSNSVGNLAADLTNDRMTLVFQAPVTISMAWRVVFMYEIK